MSASIKSYQIKLLLKIKTITLQQSYFTIPQDLHEECQKTQPKRDTVLALNQNLQQLQNMSPEALARLGEDKDEVDTRCAAIESALTDGAKAIEATLEERKDFVNHCDELGQQLDDWKKQFDNWQSVFVDEVRTEQEKNQVCFPDPSDN